MNTEWKLAWNDPELCEFVHFKEIDTEGRVITEFGLRSPSYAKLYYALKDWFGDSERTRLEQLMEEMANAPKEENYVRQPGERGTYELQV